MNGIDQATCTTCSQARRQVSAAGEPKTTKGGNIFKYNIGLHLRIFSMGSRAPLAPSLATALPVAKLPATQV